jgi:hypothetical protein
MKPIVQVILIKNISGPMPFLIVLHNFVCHLLLILNQIKKKQIFFCSLGEAISRWIRHHFSRTKRAKCLILIGPTGTGKTSFALSLPGRVNYFKERWNLDKWNDYARYSVYDDIPWDEFTKLNYPNKKGLLTQNGKMNVSQTTTLYLHSYIILYI